MNHRRPGRLRALALAVTLAASGSAFADEGGGFWSPFNRALDAVTSVFSFGDDAPSESAEAALPVGPIDQPHPVEDLAYGDLLFDYYQDRYFAAITKILVAQERGLLKRHSEHAQIVLGALYVSYGMLDKGEAIFRELLTANTSPKGADEAWYQLARIYYKRGNTAHALELLGSQIQAPAEERATEHVLLQVLCHIRLGQTDQAKTLLPYLKQDEALSVFVRFNMGSAFAQLGEVEQAEGYFRDVSERDAKSEYDWMLKDQASVALGVHYLQQEQWEQAREILERVRLYGPLANRGLLALGWTYYNSPDPASALNPWLELAERDVTDPAVQEAMLNVPYVYEQQGGLRDALKRYREAYAEYGRQKEILEQAKQDIRKPEWIRQISPVQEHTQTVMGAIPAFEFPKDDNASRYLYVYFASNEFQQLYRDYRELQRLYMVLIHWRRQLPSFNQMIATNVERLDTLGPRSEQAIEKSKKFYAYARVKLEEFNTRLDQIIANDDLAGTANVQQLAQKERLEAAEATLKALGDPEMYEEEWTKLRLLKGLLIWDMNATALDRRWDMTKDSIAIDNLLIDLEDAIRRVQAARDVRLDRFYGFETRILDVDQRITGLQTDIAAALQANRQHLQQVALTVIEQHQLQLDRMRAKALLSIARLQDRGYVQDRERQTASTVRQPVTVDLESGDAQTVPATEHGGIRTTADMPVEEKPAAKSLSEVIKRIFED
ncbi:MAG: tetratricopeptide repeat protein [Gammaproteobacteria bacterium]